VTEGCHWAAIPGRETTLNDVVKINFASVFDVALRDMVSDPGRESCVDELWSAYRQHLWRGIDCVKQGIDHHLRHMWTVTPELPLNLLCHGPIERGRDITHGGVDYYNMCVDGVALPTVADSFAAADQRVEVEGRLTWHELIGVLDADYDGAEVTRLMLRGIDRFGSGGSRAEKHAQDLTRVSMGAWTPAFWRAATGIAHETASSASWMTCARGKRGLSVGPTTLCRPTSTTTTSCIRSTLAARIAPTEPARLAKLRVCDTSRAAVCLP
jgi:hypothetical protein